MKLFRRRMNEEFLEGLKDKIVNYLRVREYPECEFIIENLKKVEGLYVENLKESERGLMVSRPDSIETIMENGNERTIIKPAEIAIDKQFVFFDENDNPLAIDENNSKLIISQLIHELLHAASRYDGQSGIRSKRGRAALNEGMTQMFAEKIVGKVVDPNTDVRYKDFKKVAKILDATFGEKVSIEAYFGHSDILEKKCNELSQDNTFFGDICFCLNVENIMYSDYYNEYGDNYYYKIMKRQIRSMTDSVYEKLCAQIIIPKLRTLTGKEKEDYISNILESVKDEPDALRKISKIIINYSKMSDKDLQQQVRKTNDSLRKMIQENQFIIDGVYEAPNCSKSVNISDEGKQIEFKGVPPLTIEDEMLKEKVLAQIFFQEGDVSKEEYEGRIKEFLETGNTEFRFSTNADNVLARKKEFAAMKVTASKMHYRVNNSLADCEAGDSIQLLVQPEDVTETITTYTPSETDMLVAKSLEGIMNAITLKPDKAAGDIDFDD